MRDLLEVDDLRAGYAASVVLDEVGFAIAPGERWALLGRNGVGKSTLVTTLMGLTRLHRGRIRFDGADITRRATHQRARLGLGWVPQERLTFASLTVDEHLTSAARPGWWTPARVYEALPALAAKRGNRGKQLSGGEQQMLAIGRALVTNPRLLLLDEPLEGLAPVVAQEILRLLQELVRREGLALVLVEQHAREALAITDRVLVLDRGRVAHVGASAELLADEQRLGQLLALA